jgi:hypothetical protein
MFLYFQQNDLRSMALQAQSQADAQMAQTAAEAYLQKYLQDQQTAMERAIYDRDRADFLADRDYQASLANQGTGSSTPGLTYAQLESAYKTYRDSGETERANAILQQMDALFGLTPGAPVAPAAPAESVTNASGNGWISVAGLGRVSFDELSAGINNGTIVATRNSDGSITYRRA